MNSAGFYNCLKLENIVEIHGRHTRVDEKSLGKTKYFLAFLFLSQHAGFKLMWVWDPSRLYCSLCFCVKSTFVMFKASIPHLRLYRECFSLSQYVSLECSFG